MACALRFTILGLYSHIGELIFSPIGLKGRCVYWIVPEAVTINTGHLINQMSSGTEGVDLRAYCYRIKARLNTRAVVIHSGALQRY